MAPPKSLPFGRLIAWDPVKQKEVWRQEYVAPWNGGTLTTAGNLVFQGTADGRFIAYNATTGEKLWETPTGTGVVAAASTYLVDGVQYVSVAVGWGGVFGITQRATESDNPGTVYTFAVGGKAPLPAFTKYQMSGPLQGVKYDPADAGPGTLLYVSSCATCHGVPGGDKGGNVRNLGYVPAEEIANLKRHRIQRPVRGQGYAGFYRQAVGERRDPRSSRSSRDGGRDPAKEEGSFHCCRRPSPDRGPRVAPVRSTRSAAAAGNNVKINSDRLTSAGGGAYFLIICHKINILRWDHKWASRASMLNEFQTH